MGQRDDAVQFDQVFTPVSHSTRAPLYAQVITQVEAAIRRGLLPRGVFLPSETELCNGFGVARTTLRRAMDELASRGVVTRTRGRGTVIEGTSVIQFRPETSDTIYDLISASHREPLTRIERSAVVEADAAVAQFTGFAVGTSLTVMMRYRSAGDVPIAALHTYVLTEAVDFELDLLRTASLSAVLESRGWHNDRTEYELMPDTIRDDGISDFFALPVGTPVLRELRRTYRRERCYIFSDSVFHPENYRIHGWVDTPEA